jgi:hypothetical protein
MADFDGRIAEALQHDDTFLGLLAQLREAASAEVTVRVDEPCSSRGCGCKHIRMVKVPDYKLKLQIMEFLANRGVGRPAAVESGGDEDRIVFKRLVKIEEDA